MICKIVTRTFLQKQQRWHRCYLQPITSRHLPPDLWLTTGRMISSPISRGPLYAPGLSARARLGTPRQLGSAPRRATTSRANFARAPAASFRPCLYTGAEDAFVARRRVLVSSPVSQSQRGEHIVPNAAAKATFDASTPSGYSKQFTVVRLTVFLRCD